MSIKTKFTENKPKPNMTISLYINFTSKNKTKLNSRNINALSIRRKFTDISNLF